MICGVESNNLLQGLANNKVKSQSRNGVLNTSVSHEAKQPTDLGQLSTFLIYSAETERVRSNGSELSQAHISSCPPRF